MIKKVTTSKTVTKTLIGKKSTEKELTIFHHGIKLKEINLMFQASHTCTKMVGTSLSEHKATKNINERLAADFHCKALTTSQIENCP